MWPLLVVALYAWQTAQQIPVWRSNVTLWTHAQAVAPQKPRVVQNYALALLEQGDTEGAMQQFRRAIDLAEAPHVPVWDRRITNQIVVANLRALRGRHTP